MGLFEVSPEGTLFINARVVANFVPRLTCAYWDVTGGINDPPVALEVKFTVEGHSTEQSVVVRYGDLDKLNFESKFPGCICADSTGRSTNKQVIRYIRKQLGDLPSLNVRGVYYPATGWYTHSSGACYLSGKQINGAPVKMPFLIDPSVKALHMVSAPNLTACAAVEQLVRILQKMPCFTLPVYGFTLYAALRSIMHEEGLPTACVLYLVGNQGYGKTTLAKRFCTLYDDDSNRPVDIFDARSTEAAMVDALAKARDRVVLLDDVCRSTSAGNQRKRKNLAAYLTKAAANETPLSRKRGKENELVECAASLVITGEIPLESASDLTRCITIEVDQRLTTGNKDDRIVAASAVAGFLQWFAENSVKERERLRTDFAAFETSNRSHREERLQKSLWELRWSFGSFLRFAKECQAISEQAESQITQVIDSSLQQIFTRTLQKIDALEISSLEAVIIAGAKKGQFACFEHNGFLCVESGKLTTYLKKFYHRHDLCIKDATNLLRQRNLLCMDKSGKATRKVQGKRVLTIPLCVLREHCTSSHSHVSTTK